MKKPLAYGKWFFQLNSPLASDIALRAAIGEFNMAFCDSRKYHNPEGIISHFAKAKYFTDNFSHHPFGWSFFGFLGALHQEPVITNLSLYRLSVAKEVGSDPTAAGGRGREGSAACGR